jgi:two-component system, OmpR family, sensor histidine kinase TorS
MKRKLKFLVIDDCEPILIVYKKLLHAAGHEVEALQSCDHALKHIIKSQPDCVLCDLIMPGLDCLAFFKQIRDETSIKQPVFIVISAKQFDFDRRHALDMGVDGYLTKPINHATFIDELTEIINKIQK